MNLLLYWQWHRHCCHGISVGGLWCHLQLTYSPLLLAYYATKLVAQQAGTGGGCSGSEHQQLQQTTHLLLLKFTSAIQLDCRCSGQPEASGALNVDGGGSALLSQLCPHHEIISCSTCLRHLVLCERCAGIVNPTGASSGCNQISCPRFKAPIQQHIQVHIA